VPDEPVEPRSEKPARYHVTASSGPLLLGLAALLEVSLMKTRYEIVNDGRAELLAAPAPLRPGGVVTVALSP
jgi:hypothetical protein